MSDVIGKGQYVTGDQDDGSLEMTDEYRYRAGIGSRFDSLQREA